MSLHAILQGGLGNQLFIIASLIGLSHTLQLPYLIAQTHISGITPRSTYWKTVFHKLTYTNTLPHWFVAIREPDGNTLIDPTDLPRTYPIRLEGYFQSAFYFYTIRTHLLELISLPVTEQVVVDHYWTQLTSEYRATRAGKIIFIHVRRGDYLHLSDAHFVLTLEWYQRALRHFSPSDLFLVFSDDLEWCQANITFLPHVRFVQNIDYIDLFLMSQCDGGIIANSSFSWWGAYLNNNQGTFVCPDIWYADRVPQKGMRNQPNWIEEPV